MRNLLVCLCLFVHSAVAAASGQILGGFGSLDSHQKPMPNPQGIVDAAQVFRALSHLQAEKGEKVSLGLTLSDKEYSSIECREPIQNQELFKASCEITLASGNRHYDSALLQAKFSGEFARILYNALNTPVIETEIEGARVKTVANITCQQISVPEPITQCEIQNFAAAVISL